MSRESEKKPIQQSHARGAGSASQRAIAPGKVTRTSRLAPSAGPSVQRKAAAAGTDTPPDRAI